MTAAATKHPLTYIIAKWYGYVLAATYLLYGGVSLILAALDRKFVDIGGPLLSLAIGTIVVAIALGFRDLKAWGWYGLVVVNGLVVLRTIFGLGQIDNEILLILSLAALGCLFVTSTRSYVLGRR